MHQADSVGSDLEQTNRQTGGKKFRGDIEGLRAVAVLAVVLFHAQVPGVGGGFVGVDVFFVISGFLITGLLWREANSSGTVRLRNFYGARARRLLPAAALVIIVTMIASAALLPLLQSPTVIVDGIASALYISNYRFLLDGVDYFAPFKPVSPFQHYWSLGVEEQFYLVWPLLIIATAWVLRRVRRRSRADATSSQRPYFLVLVVVAAGSFGLSMLASLVAPAVGFFSLPTRAWQLALGGLIALTANQWQRLPHRAAVVIGWVGLAMIVLACTCFSEATLYPGAAALLPTCGAALVIAVGCATPAGGCGRLLGLKPMQAIGRISYSWYLWHWPVLIFAPIVVGHPLGLSSRLFAALLSGVLAVITLWFVENPLRFAAPIRNSAGRSLALGAVASGVAVCVGLALLAVVPVPVGRGAPTAALNITVAPVPPGSPSDAYDRAVQQAFAQVQSAVVAAADLQSVPSDLQPPLTGASAEESALYLDGCLRNFFQVGQPDCATGDTASATTVALVGDSTAAMWNPAFEQLSTQRHWRLETMAKAGCPLMDLPMKNPTLHREYAECDTWRAQIMARLREERPRLVAVSMGRLYGGTGIWRSDFASYDPAWIGSLTRLVQQLRGIGAEVLVLGPAPDPQSMPQFCLSGHLEDAVACAPSTSVAVNQAGMAAESTATRGAGGSYVDVTDLFCTASRCPVIVGNTLVFFDRSHITREYSHQLGPAIGAVSDRALNHPPSR